MQDYAYLYLFQDLKTAPHFFAADAIAVSRYFETSSAVSVRSAARKTSVKANEILPSPIFEYRSKSVMLSNNSPAPSRRALSTELEETFSATMSDISWIAGGIVMSAFDFFDSTIGIALRTTTNAQERSGKPKSEITLGCNSPA